ncbi:MAG: dihydrolipoamide acetyltransferase family protein, partial [Acidimicrobiales bacterium]
GFFFFFVLLCGAPLSPSPPPETPQATEPEPDPDPEPEADSASVGPSRDRPDPADTTAEYPAGGPVAAATERATATERAVATARVAPPVDDVNLSFSVVANGDSGAERPGSTRETIRRASAGAVLGSNSAGGGAGPSGPPRSEGERPLASPAVRHRARSAGIDLRMVPGTGPAGRITHEDLDTYWHQADNGDGGRSGSGRGRQPDLRATEEPIIGMRRQIARRTLASTQSIPHITYVDEVDMTALESLRATLNARGDAAGTRLTLLPFLMLAMVDAIAEFPNMNAHVDDEAGTLTTYGGVHIGIATQTPNGLVVPVVRHAESLSLSELAAQVAELAELARTQKATSAQLAGSTITITSLGALGGLATTPVINKPEVAIVGVNKMVERPVVVAGQVVVRKMMNLSSSFDHRIIDGWDAASFVQRIRQSLEEPALLFLGDDDPARAVRPSSAEG